MTSLDSQRSMVLNLERGGKRLDAGTERFLSQLRGYLHGVGRGYVYYQTCKNPVCRAHELVIEVDPCMWHREESLPEDFTPWLPEMEHGHAFAAATGLPSVAADLIRGDGNTAFSYVLRHTAGGRVAEPLSDFANLLWSAHASHAQRCGSPLDDQVHRVGTRSFLNREASGEARINDLFRVVNGCVHTDTDVLLVNGAGNPLFLAEGYRPHTEKKRITFSRSLSAQAGGGLVALIREDGHVDGPLVEELWDTREPRQLIGASHGVRGYTALGNLLLSSPVFAPHIRR